MEERDQQEWATKMTTWLVDIKTAVETAKAAGQFALEAEQLTQFEPRYQALLDEGLLANPPLAAQAPPSQRRVKQVHPKTYWIACKLIKGQCWHS